MSRIQEVGKSAEGTKPRSAIGRVGSGFPPDWCAESKDTGPELLALQLSTLGSHDSSCSPPPSPHWAHVAA